MGGLEAASVALDAAALSAGPAGGSEIRRKVLRRVGVRGVRGELLDHRHGRGSGRCSPSFLTSNTSCFISANPSSTSYCTEPRLSLRHACLAGRPHATSP